jgi:hypothetical protein
MKHASSRAVYAYCNERGHRPAPTRGDIDPIAICKALGDTFMLSTDFADQLRVRLAGTRVCALFCREIKGEILADLCADENRHPIEEILSIVTSEQSAAVTGLTERTVDCASIGLEMLLLPLARVGVTSQNGVLGVLAPMTPDDWIGTAPVAEIKLNTMRHLGRNLTGHAGAPRAPTVNVSERRHGFTVYSSGRDRAATEQSA